MEEGLRVLDSHLRSGDGSLIDLLAMDARGALVLIEIERDSEDELFLRLIDHQAWVVSQAPFLRRLYALPGLDIARTPRIIVLAHDYSATARARLRCLNLPLDSRTYRLLVAGDAPALYLESSEEAPAETALPRPVGVAAELPSGAERLTPEELEMFYRFERRRLGEVPGSEEVGS